MQKELPVRKHPRLKGYDYSCSGAYFITFCVKDRHKMLGRIVGRDAPGAPSPVMHNPPNPPHTVRRDAPGAPSPIMHNPPDPPHSVRRGAPGAPSPVQLSEYGNIVRKEIEDTNLYYNNISVDKFVIMPNHVHMIVIIHNDANLNTGDGAPRASRPTSIPNFIAVLKRKTNISFGFNMWQDSYYDHIIRGKSDYLRIWQYIDENPARWVEDRYNSCNIPANQLNLNEE